MEALKEKEGEKRPRSAKESYSNQIMGKRDTKRQGGRKPIIKSSDKHHFWKEDGEKTAIRSE